MLATARSLSLIEQKRLQWAREKEEMVGLYGLWGKPKNLDTIDNNIKVYSKSNPLPPIEGKTEIENQIKAEESETSGYLSDSPKHLNDRESKEENNYCGESNEELNNETSEHQQYWNEVRSTDQENFWAEKKMYKNYRNENWTQKNSDSQRFYQQNNRNYWYGTPDSLSSDEGSRLRWGDRGVGIGHLWEPVVHHPDSRLPLVTDSYRQTPKWVEKGLKNSKADILIIHHPDDPEYDPPQKNYLLGQNAPIPPEVIEEREQRRKKALEHQNAIKKQLEERELKRRQEKENRIREERLEEERIKKEQEIERLRYEDEQRKIKEKEQIERKKEEIMKEAIELAEKRAREDKKLSKRHTLNNLNFKNHSENDTKLEKVIEQPERTTNHRKHNLKTHRSGRNEKAAAEEMNQMRKEKNEKMLKDSSSQFEEIQLAQNFQLLNMNGLPMDGGLALMLDNPAKDNFLLPPDGVQLTLLMSPKTATATSSLMPNTPLVSTSVSTGERILTPSKYRMAERLRFNPIINKSTQTEIKYSSVGNKTPGAVPKGKKLSRRCATHSGSSGASQKFNGERYHKHGRYFLTSKYRSKTSKSLEDRPKWGINRPSVQYKKQSEKDPYYQKKMKERLKKAEVEIMSLENTESAEDTREKEMSSVIRLLDCQTDEEDKRATSKEDFLLQNGYRMNSNLSSPVFVPIGNTFPEHQGKEKNISPDPERNKSNFLDNFHSGGSENAVEDEENTTVPGSVGFLTQTQLEAIRQIASLREGLKKLQKDFSNSRSTTPFSEKSVENN